MLDAYERMSKNNPGVGSYDDNPYVDVNSEEYKKNMAKFFGLDA